MAVPDLDELGISGTITWGGRVHDEFIAALQGTRGAKTYREMADNDAIIGAVVLAIQQAIRKVPWHIELDVSVADDPRHVEAAEFIESCFNDMSFTWPDTLSSILTFQVYGWAYVEKVFKIRRGPDESDPRYRSKYSDGRIGWRKLALRSQESLDRWELDDEGGIRGMWQINTNTMSSVFIPIEKAILFRTTVARNNPEGRSILRSAYRSWFYKKTIEEITAIAVDRDLVGLPVVHTPEGFSPRNNPDHQAIFNKMKNILSNISRGAQASVILPSNWKLTLLASPGQKQVNTLELLNYYDKRIAASLLGQFILLGMDRTGSFALSKDQRELFTLSLWGWIHTIAETLNRFGVAELLALNGWDDLENPPYLAPGQFEPVDLNVLSTYISRLVQTSVIKPDSELEDLVRAIGGLSARPQRGSGAVTRKVRRKEN